MPRFASLIALLFAISVISARSDAAPPIDRLLDDVASLDTGGNPASMVLWGKAEALLVSPDGDILAAAAELSRGRIIALGHGGFLGTDNADTEVFIGNAIDWLAGSAVRRSQRPVRIHGLTDVAATELGRRGTSFTRIDGGVKTLSLDDVDVVIGSPQRFAKAGRLDELDTWIRRGGGMLVTETAWGVLQLNKDLTIDTLAANTLLKPAGIRYTREAHSPFGDDGDYPVDRSLLASGNAMHALRILAGDQAGDASFAARVVGTAFASVPLKDPFFREADRIAGQHRQHLEAAYRGLSKRRISLKDAPLARAMIDLDSRRAMELPPHQVRAHASSDAFPGPVGPDRAGRVRLPIATSTPGWHSTGLYAPPGQVIQVHVPHDVVAAGLTVQIGAWRDPHTHSHRVRLRNALRRYPLDGRTVRAASAIGGPIYIDVPTGLETTIDRDVISVEITGAARAPHYKHGVTDLDEWRTTIRHSDAPWAEMESDELIFTVPASAIRDLDRPDLVMDHWDRVHAAMQSLEPRTDNHWADRPYRYVADASVSWGYMYCPANGPIVIPVGAAADMFRIENFDNEGPNKLWGHYHELGHAHQNPMWTDGATTEVTVNIFTVYALHTVNGYPLDSDVMRTVPTVAWDTFAGHRDSGKPYEDVGGAFPRLQLYALLWHEFGFDAFHATFDSIRSIPPDARPRGTVAERNTFLTHFSRVVGRDLSAYFDAWGVTVTDETRSQLATLPSWMPTEPPDASP